MSSLTLSPLPYKAVRLPPGLSLNSSTGLISGTLPLTAAGNRYAVTVTVSDGSTTTSQSFEWDVTSLALSNPGDQTTTEGVPVSLALAAQDASGRTLTFTASGLPAGLSINASSGLISGTTPVGQGSSDSSPVTVTVSDGLVSVSQTFNWAVLAVAALKRRRGSHARFALARSPRSIGRGRIEAARSERRCASASGSPRSIGRGRIEADSRRS